MGRNLLIKATREAVWSSARNSISVCIMAHEKWAGEGPNPGWVQERGAHAAEHANWAKAVFWMRTPRFTYSWPHMSTQPLPASPSIALSVLPPAIALSHFPRSHHAPGPHQRSYLRTWQPVQPPQCWAASQGVHELCEEWVLFFVFYSLTFG